MTIDIELTKLVFVRTSDHLRFKRYKVTRYFFCFQITAVINKTEKNTQCDLNFIFYEISEYVKFFLSENVSFAKQDVIEDEFRENDVACE